VINTHSIKWIETEILILDVCILLRVRLGDGFFFILLSYDSDVA
jgi:hypothetical protein